MLLLTATLLAASPLPAGFTASVERLQVRASGRAPQVVVDTLAAEVQLTGLVPVGRAARLCPKQELRDGRWVLHCSTRRLWASYGKDARGAFVDLRQITSIPWLDPEARLPMHAFSLGSLQLPETCPGSGHAAQAECALARGDLKAAKAAWELAVKGPDLNLANLRLGDVAMQDGDVEKAMQHYAKVVPVGPIGRLAHARSCELIGSCFDEVNSSRAANDESLSSEFSRELALYTLRRELYAGRDQAALDLLTTRLEKDSDFCQGAVTFCQKVVAVGLKSPDVEARMGALAAYLNDTLRHGPRQLELNREAADTAAELGAPAFAAAVLASSTPHIEARQLAPHLLRIVKLYAAANDRLRAEMILDYADARLGNATHTAGWNAVRKELKSTNTGAAKQQAPTVVEDPAALEALSSRVALANELARAVRARSQAVEEEPREKP